MSLDNVFSGKICTPVETDTTKTGKRFLAFSLSCKGKAIPCKIWTSSCEDNGFKKLALDISLTVKGFWGNQYQKDMFNGSEEEVGPKEFVVKWFRLKEDESSPETQKISRKERLCQLYGGETQLLDAVREHRKAMLDRGLVPTRQSGTEAVVWREKNDCVRHNNAWVYKIEFCMEVMGAEAVTAKLRKDLGVRGLGDLIHTRIDPAKYKEVLDLMTQDSLYFLAGSNF